MRGHSRNFMENRVSGYIYFLWQQIENSHYIWTFLRTPYSSLGIPSQRITSPGLGSKYVSNGSSACLQGTFLHVWFTHTHLEWNCQNTTAKCFLSKLNNLACHQQTSLFIIVKTSFKNIYFCFIYLKGKVRERKGGGEIFHLLFHSPHGHND